jgi:SHS2 domain-containing protein
LGEATRRHGVIRSMSDKKRFEFLEHTADVYIAAYGGNLAEAFENAAYAMFEVMTDAGKVTPKVEESVEVTAGDEYALLYSWLESLLVKFDTEHMLYSKFKITSIEGRNDHFTLKARVWGEEFDASKHPQRVGIKAATYHRMEITKKPETVTVKFILDI